MPTTILSTPADGTTSTFPVSFPYLKKADVKVYVKLSEEEYAIGQLKVEGVDYTWPTSGTIQFLPGKIPAAPNLVVRKRETDITALISSANQGTLTSNEINKALTQLLYLEQERQADHAEFASRAFRMPQGIAGYLAGSAASRADKILGFGPLPGSAPTVFDKAILKGDPGADAEGLISVESLGAVGDGVTADQGYIAAAFAFALANGLCDPVFRSRNYYLAALPSSYAAFLVAAGTRALDGKGATFIIQDGVYGPVWGRAYQTNIALRSNLAAGANVFPLVAGGGASFLAGDDVLWQLGELSYDLPETDNWGIAKVLSVAGDDVTLDRPNLKPFTLASVTWAGDANAPACKVLRKVPILRDYRFEDFIVQPQAGAVTGGHALDVWGAERILVSRVGAKLAKNGFVFQYVDGLRMEDCWQEGSIITVVDSGAFIRLAETRNVVIERPKASGVRTFISAEAGAEAEIISPRFENNLLDAGVPRTDVNVFICSGKSALSVEDLTVTGYGGYYLSNTSNGVSGADGNIEFSGRTRLIHPTEPQYINLSTLNGLLDIEIAGVRQVWDFANTQTIRRRVLLKNGMLNYIPLPSLGPVKRARTYCSPGVDPGVKLTSLYLYKVGGAGSLALLGGGFPVQAGKVVEYPLIGGAVGGLAYWTDRALQNGLLVGTASGTSLDAADEFIEVELEVATLNNADLLAGSPLTISEALYRGLGDGADIHEATFVGYDLANINAGATLQVDFAIPDMAAGDLIDGVSFTSGLTGLSIRSAEAIAGNCRIVFENQTGGAIDKAATDVRITFYKPQAGL